MRMALIWQWGRLGGNVALLLAALVAGWRRPLARPWAFAVGVLAAAHGLYYALFLMEPRVLTAEQTILFSISLRYMVVFLAAFLLIMTIWRRPWSR